MNTTKSYLCETKLLRNMAMAGWDANQLSPQCRLDKTEADGLVNGRIDA